MLVKIRSTYPALDSIKVYIEAMMMYLNKFDGVNIECVIIIMKNIKQS